MSVLAKIGLKDVDSTLATALRTIVVAVFAWLIVFAAGAQSAITAISGKTLLFLVLSGLATGGSWLCYFKALQSGDINKIVPIDKSSIVLTMLLSIFLLGEGITFLKICAMLLITTGIYLMIERKKIITYWKPIVIRPRGKPKMKWLDGVRKDLRRIKINFERIAGDREKRKNIVELPKTRTYLKRCQWMKK